MKVEKKIIIAGIRILLESEEELLLSKRCEAFEKNFDKQDILMHICCTDRLIKKGYETVYIKDNYSILKNRDTMLKIKYADKEKTNICWCLCWNVDKKDKYTLQIFPYWKAELKSLNPLFFFELSNFLIDYNAMILHSSLVDFSGNGIVFTAPSGTGKSTQADLWKKFKGAEILNGDRTIIRKNANYEAYGSPYAGSSGIYKNKFVNLKAIVVLRQADENRIQ